MHETLLAEQVLVNDYQSTSAMSTEVISSDCDSGRIVSYPVLPFPPFLSTPC